MIRRGENEAVRRRELIAAGIAALTIPVFPLSAHGRHTPFFGPRAPDLGLQLYTLDPDMHRDFDGTLRAVAELGIRLVELASLHGRTATEVERGLRAAGLACTSMHVVAAPQFQSDTGPTLSDLDRLVADAHTIGITDVVLPMPLLPGAGSRPAPSAADDRYRRVADFLNRTGERLSRAGVRMGYHNHNLEFAPIGTTTGLEILLASTDSALVSFEMDVGWVAAAGRDPIDLLRRYPGRFTQMHVKDIKASTQPNFAMKQDPTEVGSGTIDWRGILAVARSAGVRRYYIEQEPPFSGPRLAAVAKSYAYLSTLESQPRGGGRA